MAQQGRFLCIFVLAAFFVYVVGGFAGVAAAAIGFHVDVIYSKLKEHGKITDNDKFKLDQGWVTMLTLILAPIVLSIINGGNFGGILISCVVGFIGIATCSVLDEIELEDKAAKAAKTESESEEVVD